MKRPKLIKKLLVACSTLLSVALLLSIGALVYDLNRCGNGVITNISISGSKDVVLKLNYAFPAGGYSVKNVQEFEGEYIGDGLIPYDGALGKYRILICFGDVEPSSALSLQLSIDQLLNTSPVELKAKIAHPSDHGFCLYIGSDTPIFAETVAGEFDSIFGTIQIPLIIED